MTITIHYQAARDGSGAKTACALWLNNNGYPPLTAWSDDPALVTCEACRQAFRDRLADAVALVKRLGDV